MYISACKLDSSGVSSVVSTPSTSASEMNIVNTVPSFLNSVIISETKEVKSHFHILCYLKGRHRTVKVAAMVDSGATALFVTFLPDYLILSHYLTAYHWDCLSFILSPIPSTVRTLYHPVTCLSGLVTFYNDP
jgi:hypothetical protein